MNEWHNQQIMFSSPILMNQWQMHPHNNNNNNNNITVFDVYLLDIK